jgi:hypothetical protein
MTKIRDALMNHFADHPNLTKTPRTHTSHKEHVISFATSDFIYEIVINDDSLTIYYCEENLTHDFSNEEFPLSFLCTLDLNEPDSIERLNRLIT